MRRNIREGRLNTRLIQGEDFFFFLRSPQFWEKNSKITDFEINIFYLIFFSLKKEARGRWKSSWKPRGRLTEFD